MSSDIYSQVQSSKKVKYTRNEQENRTDWEDKEVNIYESAEDVDDYYSVSQPQEENQQTQRQPAGRKSSYRRVKPCKMLPWVIMSAAIITLTIYFTLEINKLNNIHSRLSANYSELQNSHNQLTDQVNRLNNTITGKWCPDGWTRFGCSCYFKSQERKSWSDSRSYCQDKGADLVIINSKAEQEFITQLNKNGESWIGLRWTQQWINHQWTYDWKWVDESPITETFWGSGLPTSTNYETYAACCNSEGKWIQSYSYQRNWICEK
ncbi:CD209 antigen-like protein E [Poeciliopsis prolifica]|uniref:CD209 antigen-like protein E n=1 Tax=Poeciliopsis prolifica TaxID=188132 RepID=UPI002412ECC5|nr:CD209 antigen-like protein E [Poeciliopsis prolifica]